MNIFKKALDNISPKEKDETQVNPFDVEFAQEDNAPLAEEPKAEIDVPEIESNVVDLPPEDVYEKEIEVEHPQNDVTILDENENGEIPPDFDETQVVDPEEPEIGETKVSDEEVNAPAETKPTEEKPKAEEPKEKGKPVKEEKPKAEDKDKEKQGKQYEHYPVGLKVAEDAAGVVGDIGNRVERIGNTQLAGSSGGADEVVRQAAIPHYDYRSFFK